MADQVTSEFSIQGLAELQKALEDLPKVLQEQVLADGLAAGGEVIREGAVARIHSKTGQTAAAIHVQVQAKAAGFLSRAGGAAAIRVRLPEQPGPGVHGRGHRPTVPHP